MRCCNRSTTLFGKTTVGWGMGVFGVAVLTALPAAQEPERAVDAQISDAVSAAVRARVGDDAQVDVVVERVELTRPAHAASLVAQPPPGARLGRPVRFALFSAADPTAGQNRRRVGYAIAEARVTMPHARAARALSRGEIVTPSDVLVSDSDVGQVPIAPLPDIAGAIGSSVTRNIREGELLSARLVRTPVLVRPGEAVVTRVAVGAVSVTGIAVARQVGRLGDFVLLENKESGRRLRGRVVARQEVEVEP